jgi:hypothetical protein
MSLVKKVEEKMEHDGQCELPQMYQFAFFLCHMTMNLSFLISSLTICLFDLYI